MGLYHEANRNDANAMGLCHGAISWGCITVLYHNAHWNDAIAINMYHGAVS